MVALLKLLPRDAVLDPGFWPTSPPVQPRQRPPRSAPGPIFPGGVGVGQGPGGSGPPQGQEALWRQALDAIANAGAGSLGYDDWFRVVAAIHAETEGSDEGLALASAWSARSAKYVPGFLDDRVWPYMDGQRDGAGSSVRGGTIMSLAARLAGWRAPIDVGTDFGPVASAVRASARGAQGNGSAATADELGGPEAGDADVEGGAGDADVVGEAGGRVLGLSASGHVLVDMTDDGDHFERDRAGVIKPTVTNTVMACRSPRLSGSALGWDEFRDEITVCDVAVSDAGVADAGTWRAITDADEVRLRMRLESLGFKAAGKEQVRDAVLLVSSENRYDSAKAWLEDVERGWDGVRRVDGFMSRYLGVEDSAYARAVARYVWTGLAGRVLDPGCQADMVVILSGDQGLRKSSSIAALAPSRDFFVEIDLNDPEDKLARICRGTLVAELAELSGLQNRDRETIKKYVVRRHEKWVPKWKEFPSTYLRRQMFFGTTNETDILADPTGERRWLPCLCTRTAVEAIERDRDQLWAEGALMWRGVLAAESAGVLRPSGATWGGGGVAWEDAERLAALWDVHAAFTQEDPWADAVSRWIDDAMGGSGGAGMADADGVVPDPGGEAGRGRPFATEEVLAGAIALPKRDQGVKDARRVGAVLRRMGYVLQAVRLGGGVVAKRWVRRVVSGTVTP